MYGAIYVDVLIAINSILGWFLLRATQKLTQLPARTWRMALAAFASGLSALLVLVNVGSVWAFLLKIASFALILLLAFSYSDKRSYLKAMAWYFLLNLLLGGVVILAVFSGAKNIYAKNFSFYIYVQPLFLILCACGVYLGITAICYLFEGPRKNNFVEIELELCGSALHCNALRDSGFRLKDYASGKHVVLLNFYTLQPQLNPSLQQAVHAYFSAGSLSPGSGLHLLQVKTATGSRLLPAVSAKNSKNKTSVCAVFTPEPMEGEFDAIIGLE